LRPQVAVRCLRESALLEPDAPCTTANLASALWTNLTVPLQALDDDAAAAADADAGGKGANRKEDEEAPPRALAGKGGAAFAAGGGANPELPKIPYDTPRAKALADEMALVLRHATKVLPPDWAHLDTVWTRLAVVHLDTGKPNLAVRALLDALAAAHAALQGAEQSGSDRDRDRGDRGGSPGTQATSKSAAPQRVFRSSVTAEIAGAIGLTLAGPGGANFPPSWWHHAARLLGDALVAAKEHGSGPLDPAAATAADQRCADHPSRVLARASSFLPRDPLLWAELGRAWLRLGLVDEGAAQLAAALALGDAAAAAAGRGDGNGASPLSWPGRASVLHGLGSAAGMNSDVEGAIGHFQAALAAEPQGPNSAATRFLLARSLAERGDEAAALDQFEEAVGLGLWVSDALLKGSAFDDLRNHPRFLSIKERMAKNSPSR
jgi:tetratricopeptide (TPR) repeat protein